MAIDALGPMENIRRIYIKLKNIIHVKNQKAIFNMVGSPHESTRTAIVYFGVNMHITPKINEQRQKVKSIINRSMAPKWKKIKVSSQQWDFGSDKFKKYSMELHACQWISR